MSINYVDLFNHIHPDFFAAEYIKSLPPEEVFVEQILALKDFDPEAVTIPVPENITYGFFTGDIAQLQSSVREVDDDWVQYYQKDDRVFCAFDGDKVVSFCILDGCGEYQGLKIGAPGCVGTIPAYRKQGIGLRMVQLATAQLKADGYDLSYIHYTAVGHWYARLGYETVLRWNANGIL